MGGPLNGCRGTLLCRFGRGAAAPRDSMLLCVFSPLTPLFFPSKFVLKKNPVPRTLTVHIILPNLAHPYLMGPLCALIVLNIHVHYYLVCTVPPGFADEPPQQGGRGWAWARPRSQQSGARRRFGLGSIGGAGGPFGGASVRRGGGSGSGVKMRPLTLAASAGIDLGSGSMATAMTRAHHNASGIGPGKKDSIGNGDGIGISPIAEENRKTLPLPLGGAAGDGKNVLWMDGEIQITKAATTDCRKCGQIKPEVSIVYERKRDLRNVRC